MDEVKQLQNKRTLPIASVITFIGFLDTHLLIPVMALYAADLGAGVGIIGLVIGLYSITNTPANILFGRLIDRIGAKVPLVIGLIGDALAMFLYAFTHLPIHLALVRGFHGLSGGLVGPSTMSIIADSSEEVGKGRAMSFYGMALATATLVGYGLGGVIASRLGYRILFFFGAIMLVAGVLLSLFLPTVKHKDETSARVSSGEVFKQIKGFLVRKGLNVAYVSVFAQYFSFGGVVTLLPIYVKNLGMEAFHVGMLLATFAIMFMLVQFPSGALSDKIGRLVPAIAGLCLGIISLVVLPWFEVFPLLALAMGLYGVAYGLLFPSISALVADHVRSQERGVAMGIFHALLTGGVAVGAPIIGWVGEAVGVQVGLMIVPTVLALALILALTALRRA